MGKPDTTTGATLSRFSRATPAGVFAALLAFSSLSSPAPAESKPDGETFLPFDHTVAGRIVPLSAESSAAQQAGPMPARPASGIVDDLSLLSVKQRTAMARDLIVGAIESDIHIYVLTLKKTPAMPVEEYARGVLKSWNAGPVAALVLYVAGDSPKWQDRFHVVPAMVEGAGDLNHALVTAAAVARANALEDPDAATALERASLELIEQFRSLPVSVRTPDPAAAAATPAAAASGSSRRADVRAPNLTERKRDVAAISVGLAALALVGLFIRHRIRNRVVILPVLEFRYRLCAPYSGGNCARFDFKEQRHHPAPPESRNQA